MKRGVRKPINTPKGEGLIDNIYITELGHLMVRVYYPETKCWINYPMGQYTNHIKLDLDK